MRFTILLAASFLAAYAAQNDAPDTTMCNDTATTQVPRHQRPVRVRPAPGSKDHDTRYQRLLTFRHKSIRGTKEEGRWEGWVLFPSIKLAIRALRRAATGRRSTKNQVNGWASNARSWLDASPGVPAKQIGGLLPAAGHKFLVTSEHVFEFMDADPEVIMDLWARKAAQRSFPHVRLHKERPVSDHSNWHGFAKQPNWYGYGTKPNWAGYKTLAHKATPYHSPSWRSHSVLIDGKSLTVCVEHVDLYGNEITVRFEDGSTRTLDLNKLIQETADHYAPQVEKRAQQLFSDGSVHYTLAEKASRE